MVSGGHWHLYLQPEKRQGQAIFKFNGNRTDKQSKQRRDEAGGEREFAIAWPWAGGRLSLTLVFRQRGLEFFRADAILGRGCARFVTLHFKTRNIQFFVQTTDTYPTHLHRGKETHLTFFPTELKRKKSYSRNSLAVTAHALSGARAPSLSINSSTLHRSTCAAY